MLALFLGLLGFAVLIYAGYPLVAYLTSTRARRGVRIPGSIRDEDLPAATLVIPAHNEEAVIEAKLRNFLTLDYPAEKLQALVISDGSSDATVEIVSHVLDSLEHLHSRRISLIARKERCGKSVVLSEEVPKLDSEIVVFTDANSFYRPDAVRRLVAPFADPAVGLVCGRLVYSPDSASFMTDEELYWRYEDLIKRWEGSAGRLLVANGSIYAIRAELFQPVPGEVADDFALPLLIAERGYKLLYEPGALAEEEIPTRGIENFRAKSRIVTQGLEAVWQYWPEILRSGPVRVGQYVFHKCARWLMGIVLAGILVASAAGATHPVLAIALGGQLVFYMLGFAAYLLARSGRVPAVLRVPFYFLLVNGAAAVGLWDFLWRRKRVTWEKSETTRQIRHSSAPRSQRPEVSDAARSSKLARTTSVIVLLVAAALSVETAVRITYLLRDQLFEWRGPTRNLKELPPWEMKDPHHAENWLLRPGATMTLRDAIETKRMLGLEGRARRFAERARRLGIGEEEIIIRVNSRGYKGPEIDGFHSKPRILTIGDLSTFGTIIDRYSFPRSMERELKRLGFAVEVVNAGVSQYLPANAVVRIEEFKALDPEVVILYMGWNALMGERRPVVDLTDRSFSLRTFRTLWNRWRNRYRDPFAVYRGRHRVPKDPDPKARAVRALEQYYPSFVKDVELIVLEMVSNGSRVFVVTLPGLYRLDEMPTEEALSIGDLPAFTNNPFVIARIADRYNQALRTLGTRPNVSVIDLDAWSKDVFHPRHDYFITAAVPTEVGQQQIGQYLATVLARSGVLEMESPMAGAGEAGDDP